MNYELKCWPLYYGPILSGRKPFDVRHGGDRQYQVGDTVTFLEWDPEKGGYTGNSCTRQITYVMHGAPFLPDDIWVLGLSREKWERR